MSLGHLILDLVLVGFMAFVTLRAVSLVRTIVTKLRRGR